MDKRTTDVVAYLTWVGLLIAFIMGDRAAHAKAKSRGPSMIGWPSALLFR